MSYQDGFEDAVELSLSEVRKSNSIAETIDRLNEILQLVKEDKFERIRTMLFSLK